MDSVQTLSSADALLVIDMQNDFVVPGAPLCVEGARHTLPALASMISEARKSGASVVYVCRSHSADGSDADPFRRHLFQSGAGYCVEGTWGAQIVDALAPQAGDKIIVKRRFSAFFRTELDEWLRSRGICRLLIAGTQYPNCIRATAVDAASLDYDVIILTDCCSAANADVAEANIRDLRAMGIPCLNSAELLP